MGIAVAESTDRVAEDSSREEGGILEKADMREFIVRADELGVDHGYFTATELIRCKDCVHFKKSKVLGNTCALTDNHVTRNDFCSKAERKEE